jgi:hypothetical protein
MSNVGSAAAGKTLIGAGTGASPTYADIGTNSGLTAHGVVIAEGTGAFQATAAGTAGQVLQSGGGASNPSYSTATYPSIAGTSGNVITSNGTNFTSAALPTPPGTTLTNHSIALGTGTANLGSVGPSSTAGTIVQSAGSSADPVFSTATYPATATGTGTILRADGTNWAASTATYPNTVAANEVLYGSASNVYSNLAATTQPGSRLIFDGTNLVWYDYRKHYILNEDWLNTASISGATGCNNASANSGTATVLNSATSTVVGVVRLSTSTPTNGSGAIRWGGTNTGSYTPGASELTFSWNAQLSALSDATDTYLVRMGFSSSNSVTTPAYGFWFEYTHSVNSGNWTINCSNGGAPNTANTSTAADTSLHNYMIKINSAGTNISFYIDGTQVANSPLSSTIPTSGSYPLLTINKSAGSTARNLDIDYVNIFINFNSART